MKDSLYDFDDFDELFYGMKKKSSTSSNKTQLPTVEKMFAEEINIPAKSPTKVTETSRENSPKRNIRTARYSSTAFKNQSVRETPPTHTATEYEYSPGGMFIKHVTVKPWAAHIGIYDKFRRDAVKYHELHGKRTAHVPFFSYLPRYDNLNSSQWAYYLYMRDCITEGTALPEADISYVLLYIYEIINLGNAIIPEHGAEILANVWFLYRRIHPMLDKYMSEWMADYCMMYSVEIPHVLHGHLAQLSLSSTVKEFYADGIIKYCPSQLGLFLRLALSDYSASKSRYASKYDNYEELCNSVFDQTVDEKFKSDRLFSNRLIRHSRVTRAVFCGAICASDVKKTLELDLSSPFRSTESRRVVTELAKGAENAVRAGLGIRARLSAPPLESSAASAASQKSDSPEYLELYDSPSLELSSEDAAELERVSWQNAARLTDSENCFDSFSPFDTDTEYSDTELPFGALTGGDNAESCTGEFKTEKKNEVAERSKCNENTPCNNETNDENIHCPSSPSDESLKEQLGETLYSLIKLAAEGKSFVQACRTAGIFADDAAGKINECAAETIGDILLESVGADYTFVEDYRELL